MSKIEIRPMEPEDWSAVSRIYLEGIATEHATFQTTCPPYSAWDASHAKECRLVLLADGVIAGWTALRRVDPRWCYRGVAEVSIYVGEQFRGHGLGYHLLTELCHPRPAHKMRLSLSGPPGTHCPRLSRPLAGHILNGIPRCRQ